MARGRVAWYRDDMKAYVGLVDDSGLHWLLRDGTVPWEPRRACAPDRPAAALVWAVLDDEAAETIHAELVGSRHREAWTWLLNLAIDLLPVESPWFPRTGPAGCLRRAASANS